MTASQRDGISTLDEKRHRFFSCELIQESGILLQLPQVVVATAQCLVHRFYTNQSLMDFDAFRVAMGCIFLASKAEEQPRRIKDIVQVFFRIRSRRMGLGLSVLMPSDARFTQWSDWLVLVERQILIEVGFSIDGTTEHPHKFLLYYIKMLDCTNECAQKAWNYVNDSFRIDLCIRYDAHVIACAAISLAARVLKHPLPCNWEKLMEVEPKELTSVAQEMLALYSTDKITWIKPLTEVNPFEVTREDELLKLPDSKRPEEAARSHTEPHQPPIPQPNTPPKQVDTPTQEVHYSEVTVTNSRKDSTDNRRRHAERSSSRDRSRYRRSRSHHSRSRRRERRSRSPYRDRSRDRDRRYR